MQRRLAFAWSLVAVVAACASAARAEEPPAAAVKIPDRTAAQMLPSTSIFYAEIARPGELLKTVLEHPLRGRIEALEPVRAATEGADFLKLKFVVGMFEGRLGKSWDDVLAALTEGGVFVGIDSKTQGGALLIKAHDDQTLQKSLDVVFALVRAGGKDKPGGKIETGEYRGLTTYQLDKAQVTVASPWLVASNKPELVRSIVDRLLDGGASLADNDAYKKALAVRDESPSAWAFLDVATLREAGVAKEIFNARPDNFVGEMIAGGVLGTLSRTPYATATLDVRREGIRLLLATPRDPEWTASKRKYFFGHDGQAAAPPLLEPEGTLLSLSLHRDLGEMWATAPDLLNEKGNAELSKADSDLSTLFGGRNFGREALGALGPQVQFVLARQKFEDKSYAAPDIKLPAGALVFQLKEPDKSQRTLRVAFQSVVGFLNIIGGQQGQPSLELETERIGDARVLATSYPPIGKKEGDNKTPAGGPIRNNFSPSVAFIGDRFIISSTRKLAVELATDKVPQRKIGANTYLTLSGGVLKAILGDNREQLVAKNMLEKGHTRQQAAGEIDLLLTALSWIDSASLRLGAGKEDLSLELELKVNQEEMPKAE